MITKALIIDEPWISKILNGDKIWEMRSTRSGHRGGFGLIRKGSGQVVGIAKLKDVSGPYNNHELNEYVDRHSVGPDLYERPEYKWRYAWELEGVARLGTPVNYHHKSGAVTWVDLDTNAISSIAEQLGTDACFDKAGANVDVEMTRLFGDETCIDEEKTVGSAPHLKANISVGAPICCVPEAKDGSQFTVDCYNNKGLYTVGEKGDEKKFDNYAKALLFLKTMPTAKWRRQNKNGNWGIVSAVEWVSDEKVEV